jgi:ubiquinol-cytochrome c reductase cytochrome b subunit
MAEAFFGYLLPWGQMSYWGAQVIVNLFSAIPLIGPTCRSGSAATTSSATHAEPLLRLPRHRGAAGAARPGRRAHLALHEVGSNNPDGVEIKKKKDAERHPLDGIPFHPYYTVKDIVGVVVFLMVFSIIVFFARSSAATSSSTTTSSRPTR